MFIPHRDVTVIPFPDTALSEEGARAVARCIQVSGRREVALDLRGVRRPTAAGGGLRLCNVGGPVYEASKVTRLTDVLAVERGGPGG
jgi:hypothetical protein